jgi:hypothetical protein
MQAPGRRLQVSGFRFQDSGVPLPAVNLLAPLPLKTEH